MVSSIVDLLETSVEHHRGRLFDGIRSVDLVDTHGMGRAWAGNSIGHATASF